MVVAATGASKRLVQRGCSALQRLPAAGQHRLVPTASLPPLATSSRVPLPAPSSGARGYASSARKPDEEERHRTQYNYDPFTLLPDDKHYSYPLVDADRLAARSQQNGASTGKSQDGITNGPGGRPREVRMLARDFIHDSLYNPHYGYFSKQAVLLPEASADGAAQYAQVGGEEYEEEMGVLRPRQAAFDFNAIRNESEFMRLVEERYEAFEAQISVLVQERRAALEAETQATQEAEALEHERRTRVAKRRAPGAGAAKYSAAGLEEAQRRGRMMALEGVQEADVQSMAAKQVWHTPTQIFQPYYAHAIARYLVAEYKLHNYPYDDLVIFELGAGSGALARGILDYLAEREPEIYPRTRYRIVEISARLAEEQRRKLARHAERVEVVHQDVLAWRDEVVQEPCFVIALEVLDNLAHDVVRYGLEDLRPYQGVVSIDETGDMHELYEPLTDPLIRRYLQIVGDLSPLQASWLGFLPDMVRVGMAKHAPFFPNLSSPVFVPTNALRLFDTLNRFFPHHRLVMSDFHALPDTIRGINAPVVQTRINSQMVPVTTFLVLQGFFDIFFPTNFSHLAKVYRHLGGGDKFFNPHFSTHRKTRLAHVVPHAHFLQRFAQCEHLQLRDGSNPILSWYQNASWFLS